MENSDLNTSVRYANKQGITFATIGAGDITLRDWSSFDLSALNRDPANMQRVVSDTGFSIETPGITWRGSVGRLRTRPMSSVR